METTIKDVIHSIRTAFPELSENPNSIQYDWIQDLTRIQAALPTVTRIYYVIRKDAKEKLKDGTTRTYTMYYQKTTAVLFPMNHMVGKPQDAKQFDTRSEAKRTAIKLFPKYTIERIVTKETL